MTEKDEDNRKGYAGIAIAIAMGLGLKANQSRMKRFNKGYQSQSGAVKITVEKRGLQRRGKTQRRLNCHIRRHNYDDELKEKITGELRPRLTEQKV